MKGAALVILAFVGVYIAGTLSGGVLGVWLMTERLQRQQTGFEQEKKQAADQIANLRQQILLRLQQQRQQQMLLAPEQNSPRLMQRFSNQLNLTPAQRQQVNPMILEALEDLRRLQREETHSAELILENLQDEIATTLSPGQRNRFDQLIEQWRERVQRYELLQQQRRAQDRLMEQQQAEHPPPQAAPSP
jgi:hypothetical protein